MTTTSQPEGEKTPAASSAAHTANSPKSEEPKTVPLGEHIELRQEHRKTLDELAKLQARLADASKLEVPADPKGPSINDVAKDLQELKTDRLRARLRGELGLASDAAADQVAKLMQTMGLDAREALSVAAMRDPKAFEATGLPTGAEPAFGQLTPRPGSSPQAKPDDAERRIAYKKALRGKDESVRTRVLENQIGHHLAAELVWEHKLLPIPDSP